MYASLWQTCFSTVFTLALISSWQKNKKFHFFFFFFFSVKSTINWLNPQRQPSNQSFIIMSSYFGLGGGAGAGNVNPQKLAAAEAELDMVTDMFNRYVALSSFRGLQFGDILLTCSKKQTDWSMVATRSASTLPTPRVRLTRVKVSAWTDALPSTLKSTPRSASTCRSLVRTASWSAKRHTVIHPRWWPMGHFFLYSLMSFCLLCCFSVSLSCVYYFHARFQPFFSPCLLGPALVGLLWPALFCIYVYIVNQLRHYNPILVEPRGAPLKLYLLEQFLIVKCIRFSQN